jgi:hypothetical protein
MHVERCRVLLFALCAAAYCEAVSAQPVFAAPPPASSVVVPARPVTDDAAPAKARRLIDDDDVAAARARARDASLERARQRLEGRRTAITATTISGQ